jgi:hypothetical protein
MHMLKSVVTWGSPGQPCRMGYICCLANDGRAGGGCVQFVDDAPEFAVNAYIVFQKSAACQTCHTPSACLGRMCVRRPSALPLFLESSHHEQWAMVLAFLNADWCACGVNVSRRRLAESREQFVDDWYDCYGR